MERKRSKKDFEFIIGNNIVYYKLDDINSPEAKGYYEKVVALNKQIKELNEKLDGLRVSYADGNKARKEQLKPTILQAEEQLNALLGTARRVGERKLVMPKSII